MKESLENLEKFAVDVIYERRKGFGAATLRTVLSGLERIWSGVVALRLLLYQKRILKENNLGCMVISIGNITVGGTGKTPVVEMFARALHKGGRHVAILSRGYKSRKPPLKDRFRQRFGSGSIEESPPRIVSDGAGALLDSDVAGDEPYMLANNLPGVFVLVDKDRVKATSWALRNRDIDTFLLDDGLQYLRLRHRLEVVLVDSNAPFGTGHLLPRGTLREPAKQLRRAHYIFLTKCTEPENTELVAAIRKHNQTAEIITCTHGPCYLEDVHTGERSDLDMLRGKHIGVVCGIAMPESLVRTLEDLGANIVVQRDFTDHHRFTRKEVLRFIDRCVSRDLDFIVTTEKDAVRLPRIENPDLPVYFLRVEIRILNGEETFRECVDRICALR